MPKIKLSKEDYENIRIAGEFVPEIKGDLIALAKHIPNMTLPPMHSSKQIQKLYDAGVISWEQARKHTILNINMSESPQGFQFWIKKFEEITGEAF